MDNTNRVPISGDEAISAIQGFYRAVARDIRYGTEVSKASVFVRACAQFRLLVGRVPNGDERKQLVC